MGSSISSTLHLLGKAAGDEDQLLFTAADLGIGTVAQFKQSYLRQGSSAMAWSFWLGELSQFRWERGPS